MIGMIGVGLYQFITVVRGNREKQRKRDSAGKREEFHEKPVTMWLDLSKKWIFNDRSSSCEKVRGEHWLVK